MCQKTIEIFISFILFGRCRDVNINTIIGDVFQLDNFEFGLALIAK